MQSLPVCDDEQELSTDHKDTCEMTARANASMATEGSD